MTNAESIPMHCGRPSTEVTTEDLLCDATRYLRKASNAAARASARTELERRGIDWKVYL